MSAADPLLGVRSNGVAPPQERGNNPDESEGTGSGSLVIPFERRKSASTRHFSATC